jgi:hypothetical protein
MNVFRVPFQRPLEMPLGGNVIALGQFGDAKLGLVVLPERTGSPEGFIEPNTTLEQAAGAKADGSQHHQRNAFNMPCHARCPPNHKV